MTLSGNLCARLRLVLLQTACVAHQMVRCGLWHNSHCFGCLFSDCTNDAERVCHKRLRFVMLLAAPFAAKRNHRCQRCASHGAGSALVILHCRDCSASIIQNLRGCQQHSLHASTVPCAGQPLACAAFANSSAVPVWTASAAGPNRAAVHCIARAQRQPRCANGRAPAGAARSTTGILQPSIQTTSSLCWHSSIHLLEMQPTRCLPAAAHTAKERSSQAIQQQQQTTCSRGLRWHQCGSSLRPSVGLTRTMTQMAARPLMQSQPTSPPFQKCVATSKRVPWLAQTVCWASRQMQLAALGLPRSHKLQGGGSQPALRYIPAARQKLRHRCPSSKRP